MALSRPHEWKNENMDHIIKLFPFGNGELHSWYATVRSGQHRIWYVTGLECHSCTTVCNVSGCLWYRLSCHQEICGWSDQETVGWCQNRHQVGAPGAKAGHPIEAPGGSLWSPTLLLLSPKSVLCISLYLGASGTCPMPAARCHYRPLLTRAS